MICRRGRGRRDTHDVIFSGRRRRWAELDRLGLVEGGKLFAQHGIAGQGRSIYTSGLSSTRRLELWSLGEY